MPPKAKGGGKAKKKGGKPKKETLHLGKKKIPANKKKKKAGKLNIEPQVEELPPLPEEMPVRHDRTGFRASPKGDFFSIIALWSVDIFQIIAGCWKALLFGGKVVESRNITDGEIELLGPFLTLCVISTTFVLTVELCLFARKWTFKFDLVLIGLYLFALSVLCCLLYVKIQSNLVAIFGACLDIGWHVVYPLKFFLIFHQRFPIKLLHTRIIVSAMQSLVFLALYLSTVFITQSAGFSRSAHFLAWIILLVFVVLLIILVHATKLWNLEVPIETEKIERFYQAPEVVTNYEHRHQPSTLFLFSVLLIPSAFFQVMFHISSVIIYPHRDLVIFRYRIDMAIGLILTLAIVWGVWMIKAFREEMKDLHVIGFIHVINAVALILFIFIPTSPLSQSVENRKESQRPTTLEFMFSNEWKDIVAYIDNEPFDKDWKRIKLNIDEPKEIKIVVIDEKKSVKLAEQTVIVKPASSIYYYLKHPGMTLEQANYKAVFKKDNMGYNFFSLVELCGKGKVLEGDRCIPVTVTMKVNTVKGIYREEELIIPSFNKLSKTVFLPLGGITVSFKAVTNKEGVETETRRGECAIACTVTYVLLTDPDGKVTSYLKGDRYVADTTEGTTTEKTTTERTTPAPTQPPNNFSNLLYPTAIITSITYGIAKISYIHFIWITIPYSYRSVLLGCYFAWIHIVDWYARSQISVITKQLVVGLAILQIGIVVYHILLALAFKRRLPTLTFDLKNRMF